ncbi:MAG TPA: hypothetical protein VH796_10465 [Nitrososphaeraceae archaeon]|jgi:hypothetical protein
MSNDENKEEYAESLNSQSTKFPSKASTGKGSELATKNLADEEKMVVVKPSEIEHKEYSQIEYIPSEEHNKKVETERSVTTSKVIEAGQSLTEMIKTLGGKAVTKTEKKTKELNKSIEAINFDAQKNTRDIQALGTHAEDLVLVYEKIMFEIEREDYNSQEKLLTGYKKLLEEQINVINSKLSLAKRLKNISK